MVVRASADSNKDSGQKTKIFVGNVHKDAKLEELRSMFEAYGRVVEAVILNNYAFIVRPSH